VVSLFRANTRTITITLTITLTILADVDDLDPEHDDSLLSAESTTDPR